MLLALTPAVTVAAEPSSLLLGVRPELGVDLGLGGPLPSGAATVGAAAVLDPGQGPWIEPSLQLALGPDHLAATAAVVARLRYLGLAFPVYPDAVGGLAVEAVHSVGRGSFAALLARIGAGAHYHLSDEIGLGIEAGVDLGIAFGSPPQLVTRLRLVLSAVLLR